MKVKTAELTGPALDWAVGYAACPQEFKGSCFPNDALPAWARGWLRKGSPSTDWSQGGPLIERLQVNVFVAPYSMPNAWAAHCNHYLYGGETPLEAAMRAIVAAELGDEIEVPDELLA